MSRKKLTVIVLGAFLILAGLVELVGGLGGLELVIAILAVAAGALVLLYSPGVSKGIGWILAAIFLIARGLISILSLSFAGLGTVMAVLALAAGILLLIRMRKVKNDIGYLLFFVWLLLVGLMGLVSLGQLGTVTDIVAVAAGLLLILGI